ncbi:MAG TPA: CHASE3 domain-containing protein, partial [Solirubrobacterales bacterium]|nr:CHASE3 domain-containing protein [Solirubrobacterales bacterium]
MRRLFSQLGFRLAAASGVLAILIGVTFGLLLIAIDDVRKENRLADRSRASLTASDGVGELVLDLETGARGFVITGQEPFLGPWRLALAEFPQRARTLERLAGGPEQEARANRIVTETRSYIRDYSIPLVQAVRRGSAAASSVAVTAAGRRRVDAIRAHLNGYAAAEAARLSVRQDETDSDVRRAVGLGIAGLIGSFALIAAFAVYLLRSVAWPVRRTAAMAARLAEGDFGARMPEKGVGEIGDLERSFNTMAGSLERSRDDLDRLLLEQGALRRVATLVAEGAEPARTFEIVTREVGVLSGADLARMERYESDTEVTAIAAWSRDQPPELVTGRRIELSGLSIAASVLRDPGPARVDTFVDADGSIAEEAQRLGIRSSVGCPIMVEGRLWGVIAASSKRDEPFPPETESQIAEFTDLVATAIANAEA